MSLPDASIFANEPIRRMTRAEYHRLGDAGFFGEEKVELLFGVVVEMTPIDQAHIHSTYLLRRLLERALGDRATVDSPTVLAASEISEPEPDLMVVPADAASWTEHPSSTYLVVEVARSSVSRDQGVKALLYGMSDVEEYWIVNHVDQVVEVYRDRDAGSWRTKTVHGRGERVGMLRFPDVEIAVSDVLPPRP
ncbi:MAG: Uma2 family endonuclease [Deltaproteobacteria bacterium]|nr:Uma2 family endonuclease [Deltaproteobacteria bacterium]